MTPGSGKRSTCPQGLSDATSVAAAGSAGSPGELEQALRARAAHKPRCFLQETSCSERCNSDRGKPRSMRPSIVRSRLIVRCLPPLSGCGNSNCDGNRSRGDPDRRVRHATISRACPLPRGGALGLCAVIPQAGDARVPARRPDAQSHGHGANHGHGASWRLPPERTPAAQLRGVRGGQHRRRGIGDRADWCPRCPRVGEEAHTLRVRHAIAAMALQRVKMP